MKRLALTTLATALGVGMLFTIPDVVAAQRESPLPSTSRMHPDSTAAPLVMPVGWTTEIDFRNHDGMLPHSAEVITPQTPLPTQPVSPAIPRAFTLDLAKGLPPEGTDIMRFTAQPAGEYLIFCGVPGHGASGMWIRLRISATAQTPAMLLTPATEAR